MIGTVSSPSISTLPSPANRPRPSGPSRARRKPDLAEQGWRVFLVKVYNEPGLDKAELRAASPNAAPLTKRSSGKPDPQVEPIEDIEKRFLDVSLFNAQPLLRDLSGLEVEYRVLQIYCRDAGRKQTSLSFGLWREADKGGPFAASAPLDVAFDSAPAGW